MKKLQKWLLVVLCVVLGLSVLSACNSHTHDFTEVGFDATNHWKYCKEDNVKDDASVKAHEYTETGSDETNHWKYCKVDNVKNPASVEAHKDEDKNGKCDVCGHAVKVTVEYGTLKGVVSLVKLGTTTASGDGVTIKVTNSKGEVAVKDFTLDKATGAYTMQCPVGEYTLKVSKKGYNEISYEIEITKNETVTMNVTLEYVNFVAKDLFGWDNSIMESYVDGKATVTALGSTVMHPTVDTFDRVAITTYLKKSNTGELQGAFVRFGEKYIWVTIKNSGSIEWNCDTWDARGKDNVTHLTWNHFCSSEWFMCDSEGNTTYQNGGNLTDEEKTMFEEGTLPLTLVRNGANVYVFVNGKYIGVRNVEAHLGSEIANGKVTVGLSCNGSIPNVSVFTYLIETDVSAYLAKCEGDVTFKYVVNGEHVNVTGKKDGFKLNDLAEITLSLEEGYTITSFKINGQEVEPTMSFKKWILDKNLADVTIDIVTAEYQPVDIEYTVNGLKPGYAQGGTINLPDGKVKLENAILKYELDLVGGKLTGNVAKGNYTLTYNGYYPAAVTVDDDLNKSITLNHINFEAGNIFWGDQAEEVYTDGKAWLALKDGQNTMTHQTTELFDNVAITVYADSTQTKQETVGVFVKFGNQLIWLNIKKDGTLEWNCNTWMNGKIVNITGTTWNRFGPNEWCLCNSAGETVRLSEEEKTMFANGTLPLTLVRKGANVYAFLNGKYIGMRNVGEEIGTSKVTVGLTDFGAVANARLSYLIETDISAYLAKCEGDSTFKYVVNGEHITVTGKTEGFKVNDFAEITIAVEEGYVITSFKINGQEVEPTMSFKKWILDKNLADVTIDIVTAEYQPVDIEYTVSGLKPGYAQGGTVTLPDGKVKLENAFFNYELDLVGGKLTGKVAKGTYTLTYDGYKAKVTVDDDLTKEIALERINNFADKDILGWNNNIKESYADGKATVTALGNTVMHQTVDTFDQVAFTTYLKKSNTGELQGAFVRFGEKYIWVVIKNDGSIEWNCDTWDARGKDNVTHLTWNKFGPNEWWMCDSDGNATYQNGRNLTDEEKAMFEQGTLPLTLVRKGASVYVFVNGKYIGVRNVEAHLGTEIANGKVTVGLNCNGSAANVSVFTYLIETDISAYLAKCEGDSTFKYVVTGEHITVTGKKEGFKVNDFAEITIAVEEGFTIKSVKVDNIEVKASQILTFKKWVLVKDLANVVIELEVVENTNVSAEIAAEGLDGFEITFINGEEQINVTVVDGKATFAGFVGTWTAKTEYMGAEIELGNVVIHADGKGEIRRIVNIFDQTSIANNWGDRVDNQHDIATHSGKVSGSGTILHKTRTSYDDVALTLYANKNATNEYIGLTMNFGKDYLWLALFVNDNNFNRIQWIGSSWFQNDNPGNNNITGSTWNNFGNGGSEKICDADGNVIYQNGNGLTAEELTMLDEGKLPITLVRKGANVYLFVNGRYVGMRNVGDEIGARKVNVGLTNFGKIGNGELSYKIETDISAYLAKCEGDSTFKYVVNGEHVTVTGKTEGFKVNDIAEITIAAEEGFTITSVKVNGVETDARTFKKWLLGKDIADVTIEVTTAAKE